jgi:nucleoside-diphosphate-sugar epimerase
MKRKILLTGASGAIGFETFKTLFQQKDRYQIRVFNLDTDAERKLFKPYQDDVEYKWGDIRNPRDVLNAVEGVDCVLHVAGIIPPLAEYHPDLAWAVNVEGTRNIIDAIKLQQESPRLLFTSSVAVYGDRLGNPDIRISDPLNPSNGDIYARSKVEAEKIIRTSGIKWSIFRLCGIFVKNLKIQPLMFHMPLDTCLEWCHDSDVGFALVEAIEHDSVFGRIFNLGGGETCRSKARDFLHRIFSLWGINPFILPEYAFATQNFHSGYYRDGDELDRILNFRRKSLQDYYEFVRQKITPFQRFLVKSIPNFLLKSWFMKMSEPLRAIKNKDEQQIQRFYGSLDAFERQRKQSL